MKSFFLAIALFVTVIGLGGKLNAAELIVNGSFETGNHTGWTVVNPGNLYWTWGVTPAGGGFAEGLTTPSSPRSGLFSSHGAFCCNSTNNPEYIQQDVTIPAAQTARFRWSDKIQSDLLSFCSPTPANCGTNVWRVQILNTSNTVLQTLYTFTATGGNNYNTGWIDHSVSLNAYAGQTIRIRFSATYTSLIGGNMNGPGRSELDAVSLTSPAVVTAANVSVAGRVLTNEGYGVGRTIITLTNGAGVTRTATTNQFGYYRLSEVEAGQTYTIAINSKRYSFLNSPRLVTVNDELTDVDFTAEP